jgi:hypothetical protein
MRRHRRSRLSSLTGVETSLGAELDRLDSETSIELPNTDIKMEENNGNVNKETAIYAELRPKLTGDLMGQLKQKQKERDNKT